MRARTVAFALALCACRVERVAPRADAGAAPLTSAAALEAPPPTVVATFVALPAGARRFTAVRPAGDYVWVLEADGSVADVVRITQTDGSRAEVAKGAALASLLAASQNSVVYAQLCGGPDKDCAYDARVGGTPRRLAVARHTGGGAAFAIDDDAVYYTDRVGATLALVRAPRSRAAPKVLFSHALRDPKSSPLAAIAVDKRYAYLHVDGVLWRVPQTGGDAAELARADAVFAPTSDGLHVYWTEGRAGHRILSASSPGRAPETIAQGPFALLGLVADTTHLYWVDAGEALRGPIRRRAKRGGADETMPVGADVEPILAVDGAYVYSIDAASHALQRSAKDTGP
jgi:hypothetical protein